ncbi:MAG: thiol oxidoreductase, partial [Acidobacteria bacterium]
PVALFSDLLLHDVGTGDGIRQASAETSEIRTPALWGLRLRRPLLHDGSAGTIEQAILEHRQEADLARRGFERLSDADRAALLAFLKSL